MAPHEPGGRRVSRHPPRPRRSPPGAVAVAARHDLSLAGAAPRLLDDVRRDGDLVVTVCDNAHEEIGADADLHWSVPDPVPVGDDAAFDAAFDEIARRVDDLAPRVTHA